MSARWLASAANCGAVPSIVRFSVARTAAKWGRRTRDHTATVFLRLASPELDSRSSVPTMTSRSSFGLTASLQVSAKIFQFSRVSIQIERPKAIPPMFALAWRQRRFSRSLVRARVAQLVRALDF